MRFKGFEEEWFRKKISDVLNYEQPTNYLVTNEKYLGDNSLLPVLTAGKTFILGYTNDFNNSYNKGNVIIIDDFTLDIRYINFAFKIKSSAIKLLTAKYDNLYFIFLILKIHKIRPTGHNRHYISIIQNLNINIPSIHEQEKIAHFFSLLDKQIELYETKLQLNELFLCHYKIINFNEKSKMKNKLKLVDYLVESNNRINYKKILQAVVGKKGIRLKYEVFLSQNQVKANHECKILGRNNLVIGMGSTQIDSYINLNYDNIGVSTAYKIFEFGKKLNYKYINYIIQHKNSYLSSKFMVIGARQGKSVDIKGFLNYEFYLHDHDYQLQILENISKFENWIALIKNKLILLKKTKKYYLSYLFL